MPLQIFDAIIYINLHHRQDRRQQLLEELRRLHVPQEKIHRIEAVHDLLNGHRGCAQSHLLALQMIEERGWRRALILEDDMQFILHEEEIKEEITKFFTTFQEEWDIFFLAANVFESEPTKCLGIQRVLCAQCAHAYVVHPSYIPTLKQCFHDAYVSMQEDELFVDSLFKAIDQKWKELQPVGRWYIGKVMGQQRRSYSDIEHMIRNRHHEAL